MTVLNKTHKPLSIPLPGGKSLHLGPLKTGQISAAAAEHAPVKKLVEAGDIEITADDSRSTLGGTGTNKLRSGAGHGRGSGSHRSGDR